MIDYQQIFNSLSIPCLLLEPVGENFVVKDASFGYCEIIGRKKEEIIGCVIPEIFQYNSEELEDSKQLFVELLEKTRDSGSAHVMGASPFEIFNPVSEKYERRFWSVENIPISGGNDSKVTHILHTVIDKTSEKRGSHSSFSENPSSALALSEETRKLSGTAQEEKYKTLIKEAFDLFAVLDREGNIKFVSESSRKVIGVPSEDLIGKYAFEHIHPEDKERVEEMFQGIMGKETSCITPFRYLDAEGNYKWFETNMRNMLNEPDFNGIVLNTRDITDLVQKTSELKDLYERYRLVACASGDLIYEWDLETNAVERFLRDNERYFGYKKKDLQQLTQWGENIHPDELEDIKTLLKKTLKNSSRDQIRSQYRFKRKDGTYAHVIDRAKIIRNSQGEAVRLVGATMDISSIIERKNALKEVNKRFSYAMKATQEMIWDWDIVNNTIERSKAFNSILGPVDDDQPSPDYAWYELVSPLDQKRVKTSLDNALANPEVSMWSEEYEIYPYKGKKAYVTDRAFIIRDAQGKAIRMVGATLDVTKSREMMKAIESQNEVLKEIAWEQAHIVRAPLARIQGLLEYIDEPLNKEMDLKEILELIKESTNELDTIVTKIVRRTENVEV